MNKTVTIISPKEVEELSLPAVATLVKEGGQNSEYQYKISVHVDDKEIGVLAEKDNVFYEGTESVKDIYDEVSDGEKILIFGKVDDFYSYKRYVAEIGGEELEKLLEENSENSENLFEICGTFSMFPGKFQLLKENQKIPQKLEIVDDKDFQEGLLVTWLGDIQIGFVKDDDIRNYLSSEGRVDAQIAKICPDNRIYVSVRDIEEEKKQNSKLADETAKKIAGHLGLPEEEVKERFEYLLENNIPAKSMQKIFASYVKYSPEVEKKVPKKPRVPFIDKDNILKSAIAGVNIGSHIMLEGLMGTGKNVLAETLAWLYKRPLYEFSMNSGVNNMDLLGAMTMVDGKVEFKRSNIIEAFEEGGMVVLDEFNIALPHVLSIFNSLLDERRRINVPGYKAIEAHKNFVAIGTQNPSYIGTFEGNQATLNRFYRIQFKEGASITDILLCSTNLDKKEDSEFLDASKELHTRIINGVKDGAIAPESINIRGFIKAANLYKEEDFMTSEALKGAVVNSISEDVDREYVGELLDNIM